MVLGPPSGSTGIHRRTRYEGMQTRYDRSAATLPTLKADDGAVSEYDRESTREVVCSTTSKEPSRF